MWLRPNTLPGGPIRIVRLPRDKQCPNCELYYREVEMYTDEQNNVRYRCPHCKLPVKTPQE